MSILFAQKKVDSLQLFLVNQQQDTNAVNNYLKLFDELKFDNPDQATVYLNKSLELSSSIDFREGTLKSLILLGEWLSSKSNYDSAQQIYLQAQYVAEDLGKKNETTEALIGQANALVSIQKLDEADSIAALIVKIANDVPVDSVALTKCYTTLSNIAYFQSNYEKSLEYDQKSLSYNTHDLSRRAKSLLNIGTTHDRLRNTERANEYYLKALDAAELANDENMIALVYLELGVLNATLKDFNDARKYYALAMQNFEKVGGKARMAHIYHNLAKIHVEFEEFDKAIEKFEKSIQIISEVNSPNSKGHFVYQLGLTYFKKKDYPRAEQYYLNAKALFDEVGNVTMSTWALSRLTDLYAAMNEYQKAYEFLQKVKAIDDSVVIATSARNVAEIEEKYQNEQKQKEIELLIVENQIASLEIQKQEDLRNYLILAAFLLVLLIGVVYSRYQLKVLANAKLQELDSLKTNFFTNISHEFRTPLTLILSPLQKLLHKNTDQETKEALSIIHRNASLLTELTNQLLDLSKLEAGELELNVSQSDFKSFTKVTCASFESLAIAQKVAFIQDLESAPDQAYFDKDKVQKILNNLLSNAFKFTSNEGQVTIAVGQKDGKATISVQDTGNGISQENQKLIFNRFHQSSTNQLKTGTGIGLTLSKELALLHKGDIKVASDLGQGATFTFSFPISISAYQSKDIIEDEAELVAVKELTVGTSLNEDVLKSKTANRLVLIVEDNSDLRNHMTSLLKDDFNVKQASNGKVGIEDALNLVPDIIVTDLMMPEVDGVELCNTLKANEKTSHIPIIMLTAKADRDTKLDGLKTGADDFLTKPFDNEELRVRIQNLIDLREKLQAKYQQTLRLEPSKIVVKSPEEAFIKRALEVVDQNLSNSEFTAEAFQKEMGMSRMQLHRKLKVLTNLATSEFVRDIRLQRAADLLSQNGLNITEVAYSCGFNSISYFTQCFKQKFGVSPSSYKPTVS